MKVKTFLIQGSNRLTNSYVENLDEKVNAFIEGVQVISMSQSAFLAGEKDTVVITILYKD